MRRDDPRHSMMRNLSRKKMFFFASLAIVLGVVLLEGALGLVWLGIDLAGISRSRTTPEIENRDRMLREDPELGWDNVSGFSAENHYGTGRHLTISAQGTRGVREYAIPKPPEVYRVVCLGDSFTFGAGISDEDCFPNLLEQKSPKIEAVNLGVSGYSVGQMWMRYQREGEKFDGDLLLVSIIWEDIERLRRGVPRWEERNPKFRVTDGQIEGYNIPFPPVALREKPDGMSFGDAIYFVSRKSGIARTVAGVIPAPTRADRYANREAFGKVFELSSVMLTDLHRLAKESNRDFALVLIPTLRDLTAKVDEEMYLMVEGNLRAFAEQEGFPFIGLREVFLDRSEEEWRGLYLDETMDINRHCSARGYELIADEIHNWLLSSVPRYAEIVSRTPQEVGSDPPAIQNP